LGSEPSDAAYHHITLSLVITSCDDPIVTPDTLTIGFRKTGFLKKPNPLLLGVLLVLDSVGLFRIFHLNVQLGSLSVDLAHQLSFYLHLPVL